MTRPRSGPAEWNVCVWGGVEYCVISVVRISTAEGEKEEMATRKQEWSGSCTQSSGRGHCFSLTIGRQVGRSIDWWGSVPVQWLLLSAVIWGQISRLVTGSQHTIVGNTFAVTSKRSQVLGFSLINEALNFVHQSVKYCSEYKDINNQNMYLGQRAEFF